MRFLDKAIGFVERSLPRSESAALGMSNIYPEDSGIPNVTLWASTGYVEGKKLKHGPRIKVYIGKAMGGKSISVTLTKPPRVLGTLPSSVEKKVLKFIDLNFDVLMAHWEAKLSSKAFLNQIKSIA